MKGTKAKERNGKFKDVKTIKTEGDKAASHFSPHREGVFGYNGERKGSIVTPRSSL